MYYIYCTGSHGTDKHILGLGFIFPLSFLQCLPQREVISPWVIPAYKTKVIPFHLRIWPQ